MWKLLKAMKLVSVRGLRRRKHIRLSEFKNLPPDLWLEILARLPVKILLRFRSVCKTWCSIIDSYDFISMHLTLYKNNLLKTRLLTFEVVPQPVSTLMLYSIDSFKRIGQLLENSGKFYFVGNCNGLLLQGYGSKFRLLNPSINKSRILPPCPIDCESGVNYILGFAPSRNDYKVVGFTRNLEEVAIYSLRDHCWRIKSDVNMVLGSCFLQSLDINSVVFLEKAAYWFDGDTRKFEDGNPLFSYVASFDFDAEEFSVFDLPDDGERVVAQFIFILGNAIAVLSMNSESTYVWILDKNDSTKEPWRLCFSTVTNSDALKLIEGATDLSSMILYVQHSNTVLIALDGKLMYYNLSNHQVQLLRESTRGHLVIVTYVENLMFHKCQQMQTLTSLPV